MIKIAVGMILVAFDYVISPDGKIKIDLLPDFIGYAIIAYSFYKIYKNHQANMEHIQKNKSSKSISVKAGRTAPVKKGKSKDKALEVDQKNLKEKVKQGVMASAVVCLLTYIAYLLDLYGMLAGMPVMLSGGLGLGSDLSMLLVMYLYLQILSALQGEKIHFQVQRMMFLWKMTMISIACEYISFSVSIAAMTFLIFEKLLLIIFICYIMTSSITYKEKF